MTNPGKKKSESQPNVGSNDKELPQPQNSNHHSTAPLKDKLITNSSYLAAEIPLKLGHFVSNLWTSSSDFSNTLFMQQNNNHPTIWVLSRSYSVNPTDQVQQALFEAQRDIMFRIPDEKIEESGDLLWPPDFYNDFTSRLWMTYRHNFPPIRPSNLKTDIGWGCMLRSGQSLLANTLILHFLGRDWRRQTQSQGSRKKYNEIVHWFLDELSPRAPFSIHRVALLGKQLGKNIGEWFGPSTISRVIQVLVSDFAPADLTVYNASDGMIYKDEVHGVATGKSLRGDTSESVSLEDKKERSEAKHLYDASTFQSTAIKTDKFKSVLILVPLRLGIDSLHSTYYEGLKACFGISSFVGIAGGRPNSSLYFVGLIGDELIYLDPHHSRPALETKHLSQYTKEEFATYHCSTPRKIRLSSIDPSMMVGFYCRNMREFDLLCQQIEKISKNHTPIVSIEQSAPDYDEDALNESDFGIVSDEENELGFSG
ncbi:hypothetical protein G6F56_008109 [Rhizopus delemar]|uniref:Cysteine protease n=1 Tax=Rhizopus stolonifer TaxID=4846 RepID=A0A367J556_RHIST|nr:hypothetical protein G6F56_008109 [Rhizopus delemar]RCH84979.1 Cysteine protease atg4 [Rhizopus stolonifer]